MLVMPSRWPSSCTCSGVRHPSLKSPILAMCRKTARKGAFSGVHEWKSPGQHTELRSELGSV